MEIILLENCECPYAAITKGHVDIKKFLHKSNKGWKPKAFEQDLTRYEYILIKNNKYKLNRNPFEKGVKKYTVSYFEEPMKRQYEERTK